MTDSAVSDSVPQGWFEIDVSCVDRRGAIASACEVLEYSTPEALLLSCKVRELDLLFILDCLSTTGSTYPQDRPFFQQYVNVGSLLSHVLLRFRQTSNK